MVAKTFSLGSSFDYTCNVDDLQNSCDFRLGLEHFAEVVKALIWDWNNSSIRLDSAEGIVFSCDMEIGEEVVGG